MSSSTTQATPISAYAIVVAPEDNLAVVKESTAPGLEVTLASGRRIRLRSTVPPGHRFATRDIPAGDFVLQYGQPIGTSLGIREGEMISHDNMTNDVPVVRDLPEDLQTPPPTTRLSASARPSRAPADRTAGRDAQFRADSSDLDVREPRGAADVLMSEFLHYSRERYPNVDGVVAIPHNKGCGCQDGSTIDVMLRTLSNYADHPNVGGVILMDLGCEKTNLERVEKYL